MIHAPYNFVPLADEVFLPDWSGRISLDVPFRDGLSGTLTIAIEALSPLFVRDGYSLRTEKRETSFSHTPDGRYFIPATSVKGAVRGVMEILSFSKMSRVSTDRYGIRDLRYNPYLNIFRQGRVHCGWLTRAGDTLRVEDCGVPYRVSHAEIDHHYGTAFRETFREGAFRHGRNNSALDKYRMLAGRDLSGTFATRRFSPKSKKYFRMEAVFNPEGTTRGTLVLTGQAGPRKERSDRNRTPSGKFYEFMFPDIPDAVTYSFDAEDELFRDFCFLYADSAEWRHWQGVLREGSRVPVFFSVSDGHITSLGLSYLYKLPYPKRLDEYLPAAHRDRATTDLCECVFGKSAGEDSLKGRVRFSHAFLARGEVSDRVMKPYLSAPKPTYYPNYIRQDGTGGEMRDAAGRLVPFRTMLNADARPRGWKRYPAREGWETRFPVAQGQMDNATPFRPMCEGARFVGKVRFFNLKPEELGALLSALELPEGCRHSFGLAKPYGYGQARVTVTDMDCPGADREVLKRRFREMMARHITNYERSPQLTELWKMLAPHANVSREELTYMDLGDFARQKQQNERHGQFGAYLPDYSEIVSGKRSTSATGKPPFRGKTPPERKKTP